MPHCRGTRSRRPARRRRGGPHGRRRRRVARRSTERRRPDLGAGRGRHRGGADRGGRARCRPRRPYLPHSTPRASSSRSAPRRIRSAAGDWAGGYLVVALVVIAAGVWAFSTLAGRPLVSARAPRPSPEPVAVQLALGLRPARTIRPVLPARIRSARPDRRVARGAAAARAGSSAQRPWPSCSSTDGRLRSAPLGRGCDRRGRGHDGRRAARRRDRGGLLAAGMTPTAATFGGAPGVAVLGACGIVAILFAWAGWIGGRRLPWVAGLDPTVPAFAPGDRLFGPRSVRAFGAAIVDPDRFMGQLQRAGGGGRGRAGTAVSDGLRVVLRSDPADRREDGRGSRGRRRDGLAVDRNRLAAAQAAPTRSPAPLSPASSRPSRRWSPAGWRDAARVAVSRASTSSHESTRDRGGLARPRPGRGGGPSPPDRRGSSPLVPLAGAVLTLFAARSAAQAVPLGGLAAHHRARPRGPGRARRRRGVAGAGHRPPSVDRRLAGANHRGGRCGGHHRDGQRRRARDVARAHGGGRHAGPPMDRPGAGAGDAGRRPHRRERDRRARRGITVSAALGVHHRCAPAPRGGVARRRGCGAARHLPAGRVGGGSPRSRCVLSTSRRGSCVLVPVVLLIAERIPERRPRRRGPGLRARPARDRPGQRRVGRCLGGARTGEDAVRPHLHDRRRAVHRRGGRHARVAGGDRRADHRPHPPDRRADPAPPRSTRDWCGLVASRRRFSAACHRRRASGAGSCSSRHLPQATSGRPSPRSSR